MTLNTEHVPDFDGLLTKYSILPKFTPSELKDSNNFLESVGCVGNKQFACLLFRDNAYIRNRFPNEFDGYTSYRNSNSSTYIKAAEALGELGFHVFRMGTHSENALKSNSPNVIDYARNRMRSEFLDIFLSSHCTFFMSTGSGLDKVAKIFRRLLTYLNL